MTTVFQRVGPFQILRRIGHGGMAWVFLAEDTRSQQHVALKLVPTGNAEILDAERYGAKLQAALASECPMVPTVFETGEIPSHYYIAMEYVEGENLSDLVARGPVPPERAAAIAIQICRFLNVAHRFDRVVDGRPVSLLVHGDLKPGNVRIASTGEIRILDFGIAKALSLSRKVTRNDFGSLPYMSPERIDSADSEVDASVDLWALGVILYEVLSGAPPFHAADTRRVEQQIRTGYPRKPLPDDVPLGLRAIVARLLSPDPTARYAAARDVLEDLEHFTAAAATGAERQGFPARADDIATRRTRRSDEGEPTRRTRPEVPAAAPETRQAAALRLLAVWLRRVTLRGALLVAAFVIVTNEAAVAVAARVPAARARMADQDAMVALWADHQRLSGRSLLGMGASRLGRALQTRARELAEQVIANYRGPVPTVRERQWENARANLQHALALAPDDRRLRAALRYCEGHLHRINGDAEKGRGRRAAANQHFANAVIAFREAAELRREWPDPFLGLARTFIYGLEDIDRAADAIEQAQRRGFPIGEREIAQLGDGYRARGEALRQTARQLARLPQEDAYLQRSLAAYREALAQYERIPSFPGVAQHLRRVHLAMDEITARLAQLDADARVPGF